jgi:hypothetical protein
MEPNDSDLFGRREESTTTRMKNRMGIGSPEKNATDTYERGMKIVPDCISATENEIPIKQYNIAVLRNLLRFERAEGKLQVTNKRVIFRAPGTSLRGRTTIQQEYAIDEVAGIEARNNYKFNFLYLIFVVFKRFGLKLFILCFSIFGFQLALVASEAGIFYLGLWLSYAITAVCIFIYCFRQNLVICLLNKQGGE